MTDRSTPSQGSLLRFTRDVDAEEFVRNDGGKGKQLFNTTISKGTLCFVLESQLVVPPRSEGNPWLYIKGLCDEREFTFAVGFNSIERLS